MAAKETLDHVAVVTLSASLDGQLDAAEQKKVDRHLKACAACHREMRVLQIMRQRTHALPVVLPPERFYQNVLRRVRLREAERKPVFAGPWLKWVGTAAVACSVFLFVRQESTQRSVQSVLRPAQMDFAAESRPALKTKAFSDVPAEVLADRLVSPAPSAPAAPAAALSLQAPKPAAAKRDEEKLEEFKKAEVAKENDAAPIQAQEPRFGAAVPQRASLLAKSRSLSGQSNDMAMPVTSLAGADAASASASASERAKGVAKNEFAINGPAGARTVTRSVAPIYPSWAKDKNIVGTARIYFIVTPEGTVRPDSLRMTQTSGDLQLDEIGREAVKQWTFAPTPTETWGIVTFSFPR